MTASMSKGQRAGTSIRSRKLIAWARRNRVAGWTPRVLNAEDILLALTTTLDIVLNDNGQCEREPSSDRAVVSRLLAALIATVEDSVTVG